MNHAQQSARRCAKSFGDAPGAKQLVRTAAGFPREGGRLHDLLSGGWTCGLFKFPWFHIAHQRQQVQRQANPLEFACSTEKPWQRAGEAVGGNYEVQPIPFAWIYDDFREASAASLQVYRLLRQWIMQHQFRNPMKSFSAGPNASQFQRNRTPPRNPLAASHEIAIRPSACSLSRTPRRSRYKLCSESI